MKFLWIAFVVITNLNLGFVLGSWWSWNKGRREGAAIGARFIGDVLQELGVDLPEGIEAMDKVVKRTEEIVELERLAK